MTGNEGKVGALHAAGVCAPLQVLLHPADGVPVWEPRWPQGPFSLSTSTGWRESQQSSRTHCRASVYNFMHRLCRILVEALNSPNKKRNDFLLVHWRHCVAHTPWKQLEIRVIKSYSIIYIVRWCLRRLLLKTAWNSSKQYFFFWDGLNNLRFSWKKNKGFILLKVI